MAEIIMSRRERIHAEKVYRAAATSMVLLENNGALPLPKCGTLALYGIGAVRTVRGGTGSGDPFNGGLSCGGDVLIDQSPRYHIHILDAFLEGGYEVVNAENLRRIGQEYDAKKVAAKDIVMQTFAFPEPLLTGECVCRDAEMTDTAVYVLSRNSGEGSDRSMTHETADGIIGDYLLSPQEEQNLALLRACFRKLILVLNVGGIIDAAQIKAFNPDSILLMGLAGQEGGRSVRDVMNATLIPTGKLTDTWGACYEDYPAAATFANNDGDSLREAYSEGIFVGYRFFDSFARTPIYEFGYGIGYTTFDFKLLHCTLSDALLNISAEVVNTGAFLGAEVLQLYTTACDTGMDAPVRELKAFSKTNMLSPGEKEMLTLTLNLRDLAVYDTPDCANVIKRGNYLVWVGTSSRNNRAALLLHIQEDSVLSYAPPVLPLREGLTELSHRNTSEDWYFLPELGELNVTLPRTTPLHLPEHYQTEGVITYTTDKGYIAAMPYETVCYVPEETVTWDDIRSGKKSLQELAAQMTNEELAMLNCGSGWGVADENNPVIGENSESCPGAAGETTRKLEKYRLPSMVLVDGPGGIRIRQEYEAINIATGEKEPRHHYCTALPSGTLLAQSFEPELLKEMGALAAVEMREMGCHILLAPGMNIHRDPLCGRNFEYYSEDPMVSGIMAAAFVNGMQNEDAKTGACIKHFAANNQETNRSTVNEIIGQRALREIYLKGFEIAVRSSAPYAIMTSYNLINGVPTADSYDLCTRLARGEWGFEGLIMTDWNGGSSSADLSMHAGNDLIMPGGEGKKLDILLSVEIRGPEFDERGQVRFVKPVEFFPNYDSRWNSFVLSPDGNSTVTAPLGDGHVGTVDNGRILVDGAPVYTVATPIREFFLNRGEEIPPLQGELTTELARLDTEKNAIIYRGDFSRPLRICRGDLQSCAIHNLTILQKTDPVFEVRG